MCKSKVRELNDKFRTTMDLNMGRWLSTAGVVAKGDAFVRKAIAAVVAYSDFNTNNDPWGEHDGAMMEVDGEKVFWKIDVYDLNYEYGAEDEAKGDPHRSRRVMTIMLSGEY
jgi:hypothetical protein